MTLGASIKVSVIVAVKNGEKTLQRCIDSICRQTHLKKELIIIDGDSTDASVDIIKHNSACIFHWESKKDKGVYQAWNRALEHASGDWICFLGADDYFWNDDCLSNMCDHLNGYFPENRIVYGIVNVVSGDGNTLYTIGRPWSHAKKKFFQINCLPHPGMMHHRSVFQDYGNFDDTFIIAGDYELLLRELSHRDAKFVPITMVGMQVGGISSLTKNSIIGLQEMRKALKIQGIRFPGIYWMLGMLKSYYRISINKLFSKQS